MITLALLDKSVKWVMSVFFCDHLYHIASLRTAQKYNWQFHSFGMWCCISGWIVPDVLKDGSVFILKHQVDQDKLTQFCLFCLTLENEGNMFVWNIRDYLHSDAASHSRTPQSILLLFLLLGYPLV
jgi:hypothetical protein